MKTLIEIAIEKDAYIIDHNTAMSVIKGEIVFANEAQIIATHDAYCQQFEPVKTAIWDCNDIDTKNCKDGTMQKFCEDNIRLAPFFIDLARAIEPAQIPSEVKAYIERLKKALDLAFDALKNETYRYPSAFAAVESALASKPDCLKD